MTALALGVERPHVVVLSTTAARTEGFGQMLEDHAAVVIDTTDVDEASSAIDRFRPALVVVSSEGPEVSALQVVARVDRTRTTVVWLVEPVSRPIVMPRGFAVDAVWEFPMLPETLEATLSELVSSRFYSPWVESRLAAWATYALREGFSAPVIEGACFRKTTRSLLEVVSALIPFAGLAASGRMIVSASARVLDAMFREVLGDPPADGDRHLYGLAGELANLALGRAQRDLRSERADFALGHPMLVSGDHFRLRYLTDRPSLVYRAQLAEGPVFFELCIDRSPERLGESFVEDDDASGHDIVFL